MCETAKTLIRLRGRAGQFEPLLLTVVLRIVSLQSVTVLVGEPIDFKDALQEMKKREASQVGILLSHTLESDIA